MTTLKVGMTVVCVKPKEFYSLSLDLLKGSIHKIRTIRQDELSEYYVELEAFPEVWLDPIRFEPADEDHNPILYKIREMSERFEKRKELNYA